MKPPKQPGARDSLIVVRQGSHVWTVNESKIDTLPGEIQFHVGRLLGRETALALPRPLRFRPRGAEAVVSINGDPRMGAAIPATASKTYKLQQEVTELKKQLKRQEALLNEIIDKLDKENE